MDAATNIQSILYCATGYYASGTAPSMVCTACPTNSASCTINNVVCKSGYTPIGGTSIGGFTTGDAATDL